MLEEHSPFFTTFPASFLPFDPLSLLVKSMSCTAVVFLRTETHKGQGNLREHHVWPPGHLSFAHIWGQFRGYPQEPLSSPKQVFPKSTSKPFWNDASDAVCPYGLCRAKKEFRVHVLWGEGGRSTNSSQILINPDLSRSWVSLSQNPRIHMIPKNTEKPNSIHKV